MSSARTDGAELQDGITVLFPGPVGAGATSVVPAETLFAQLAAEAETSIDLAVSDFDHPGVLELLGEARGRNVRVRVVADSNDDGLWSTVADEVSVPDGISGQHNSFAILDGRTVWTGSADFTSAAFTSNAENVVVITSTAVAGAFAAEFEHMLAGRFSRAKPERPPVTALVGDDFVEVAFAPDGGTLSRTVAAIDTGGTTVRVAMHALTARILAEALIRAHARGAQVEVLLDGELATSPASQYRRLCLAGIKVSRTGQGKLHDKYVVVDAGTGSNPTVVTGSADWSGGAIDMHDENVVVLRHAAVAQRYATNFAALVAAMKPEEVCTGDLSDDLFLPRLGAGDEP